jgi:SNF2 family DNA or RNA helicase
VTHFNIWPQTTQSEKDVMLRQFNDPEHPVQFLVVNSRSTAVGVNLQGACHKMLILEMTDNINTVMQAIGRIHRIGQDQVQFIWLVCQLYTYDQNIFTNATAKMLAQVAGESEMPTERLSLEAKERMMMQDGADNEVLLAKEMDQGYRDMAAESSRPPRAAHSGN